MSKKILMQMKYDSELFPFESKWIDIAGQKIHYVDEGQGQPILFSHAAIGSSFMYREFIGILKHSYRCVAFDFPGFGLSTKKDSSCGVQSQSEFLKQFVKKVALEHIIGFGHDTGGPSIFKVAADCPELFDGLILTDTIIFPTNEYKKIDRMLKVLGSSMIRYINRQTNFLVRLTFNFGVVTKKVEELVKSQYYQISKEASKRDLIINVLTSLRTDEEVLRGVKKGFETTLKDKPVLLIYGEKDPVAELGIPDRVHSMVTNSELFYIPEEGHFPHEGQPIRMVEIISEWIKNNIQTNDSRMYDHQDVLS